QAERIVPRAAEGEEPYRGQWLAPFMLSPHNPRIVYLGLNRLFRSMDRGADIQPISPDLTTNDPATRGDIPYQTITTIAESYQEFGQLWVGTDDGRLHVTRDSGATWTEVVAGLEPHTWISRVEASHTKPGTAYVAQNGKRYEDFRPLLWRTEDYGATWQDLSAGIPSGPINVVREDPKNHDLLYVGTDLGVYVSTDRGASWAALPGDLPFVAVHDLVVHPRDDIAVIATHGGGMWAMDIRPLQASGAEEEPPAEPESDG
ncbi:MAG TPA: hypothetical protein VGC54_10995, partial [Planctomycetota bacterium]